MEINNLSYADLASILGCSKANLSNAVSAGRPLSKNLTEVLLKTDLNTEGAEVVEDPIAAIERLQDRVEAWMESVDKKLVYLSVLVEKQIESTKHD